MNSALSCWAAFVVAITISEFARADIVLAQGAAAIAGSMEGVDRNGMAYSVYRLGVINTRMSHVSVYAFWSSSKKMDSSLFGNGWCVPALESRMYPTGADTYEMIRADGRLCRYRRVSGKKDMFAGDLSDCAIVRPNGEIRVYWSSIVTDKADLIFRGGRLSTMRVNESVIEYRYDANGSVRVVCDGKEACRAEISRKESRPSRIAFANGVDVMFKIIELPVWIGGGPWDGRKSRQFRR